MEQKGCLDMRENALDFFMGAIAPTGFCGYYAQFLRDAQAGNLSLLKAGPGCGKSTLLSRTADALLKQGETVECIRCAGDPASLDAIFCRAKHISMFDATAPHAAEPKYPVAVENVVSLYDALDVGMLRENKAEIVALFEKNAALSERATRYITAAGSLLQDTARTALCFTDTEKARSFAAALGRRYLPMGKEGASEDVRLLSAVTCEGICFFDKTITQLADTIVVLDDGFGAAGKVILNELRMEALAKGHHIITCYCSLSPFEKIEHLFVPSLRLCFATSNAYHTVQFDGQRTIHCTRFCNKEGLALRQKRLKFNKKAVAELLAQAQKMLCEAKSCHDALEVFYTQALDFKKVDAAWDAIALTL